MKFQGKKIGFALTGSHCTLQEVLPIIKGLIGQGAEVTAILSESIQENDTRFGEATFWKSQLEKTTGKQLIQSILEAEPVGPKELFDVLIVAPCTGNTMAKLANAITDTVVLMAVKAQLRNLKPVVLAISTNDGLSNNLKNIGLLITMKNIYMVPFRQDAPKSKAYSLVANMQEIPATVEAAMQGVQVQPILLGPAT